MDTEIKANKKPKLGLYIGFGFLSLFVIFLFMSIPVLDGPSHVQRAREAVTVGNMRRLNLLEKEFESSNPTKGFACQLSLLRSDLSANKDQPYDPDRFLTQDSYDGYRIFLLSCQTNTSGIVTTYQAVAIPREPRTPSIRAFCTDQTGAIWFDDKGSAEGCLASANSLVRLDSHFVLTLLRKPSR